MMNANSFERRSWRTVTGIVCQYCKKAAERESFLWKFCTLEQYGWLVKYAEERPHEVAMLLNQFIYSSLFPASNFA